MMKLLTHNMLTSKCLKGVTVGFPLKLVANEVKEVNVDFNKDFIERMIPKVDWSVLTITAQQFGVQLPDSYTPNDTEEEVLKRVHHALLEIEVIDGELICPETGRKFPISQGIPNMLCNEDEV
ncbi:multifunctional methyltransferase subunit TRM112-like protein [Oppia nitens]|uniref:multifunctional methyltransferase subunit TRM112-like protein n=1 Tax=Oppia nitens TaxID=1686743 RepID=UPI0023DCD7AF|nr:multifunctional methyltransferase subunit TRM112-like protein [Oppia nitens]